MWVCCRVWQVYEDSVELQLLFMKQRDELCRHGEVLLTPALDYTSEQLTGRIDDQRRELTSREQHEDDDRRRHAASATGGKAASAQVRSSHLSLNTEQKVFTCQTLFLQTNSVIALMLLWHQLKAVTKWQFSGRNESSFYDPVKAHH